jgi:NADH:ubiquinone oxidoreductase subunit E
MKTIEAIEKVREKINQNSTNDNIAFDDARIITALNEAQNKFLEWITKNQYKTIL